MELLVQEAIDFSSDPIETEAPTQEATEAIEKTSDFADLSEDESSAPDVVQELRQCGIEIRQALLDGLEVSD